MHGILGSRGLAAVTVLFSLLLMSGAASVRGDELSTWYHSDPRARAYAGVHAQLGRIFSEAQHARIPPGLLTNRLREGAAKKVTPDVMVNALRADLALYSRARLIAVGAGVGGTSFLSPGSVPEGTLKAVGIYLRAGLSDHLIGELLSTGSATRGGTESALAACQAIVDLRAVAPIEDADSLQIGKLLMTSGMQPSGYSSLALVYGLGVSRGLSQDHLVHDVIINTLSTGGGLAMMSQKIQSTPVSDTLGHSKARDRARSFRPVSGSLRDKH